MFFIVKIVWKNLKRKVGIFKMIVDRILTILISFMLVLGVGYFVCDSFINDAVGSLYNEEDWNNEKKMFCVDKNMEPIEFINKNCWLLGCTEFQDIKCVCGFNEVKVDTHDERFCKYKFRNDIGECE